MNNLTGSQRIVAITARALVLASAALLAGCYTAREVSIDRIPDDYRQRHPIVLKEAPRTLEVFVGSRRGSLNPGQRADVVAFARQWRQDATGGLLIDLPTSGSNAASAAAALHEVRSLLSGAGVPHDAVQVRPHHSQDPAKLATLKLHYPRVAAEAGPCGLWPHDLGPTYHREHYENRQYYNFGCANQRNLAAMVDNPTDLVQPRSDTPSYTGRRTTVLEKYQRGESTATVYPDAGKGKISDVGQ